MIYLLDTDHISLMDRGRAEGVSIQARLARIPRDDVSASVISYEEQTRGWMAVIAQALTAERQIPLYAQLRRLLRFYCNTPLLAFDRSASEEFERLRRLRLRVGTMDLKIAASALANDATLLTRNLTDFGKIPGLRAEDWSL